MRGAYAESDLDKGTIRINKKRHFNPKYKRINPTKDGHENLTSTVQHELLHFKHPNMTEKDIRKKEKSTMETMTPKRKKQLLGLLK